MTLLGGRDIYQIDVRMALVEVEVKRRAVVNNRVETKDHRLPVSISQLILLRYD